jgi:Ca2+-binding RTX toxin-like protein
MKNDDFVGTAGADHVDGRRGNDRIDGQSGDDTLVGDAGNDHLIGNFGNDTLLGGDGNDLLQGFSGSDTLTGGAGADLFWYYWDNNSDDVDRITDFNRAEGDQLYVPSALIGRGPNIFGWLLVEDSYRPDLASSGKGQIVQAANADGTSTLTFYYVGSTFGAYDIVVNTKLVAGDFEDDMVDYPAAPTGHEAADFQVRLAAAFTSGDLILG